MMGVDTKAILNGARGFEEIEKYIKARFEDVKLYETSMADFVQISFMAEDNRRLISVHGPSTAREYGFSSGILVSLGSNDQSIKIIEDMVETFGGWYCRNDCDDTWEQKTGMFYESGGIPYFYRWGIINGHITDKNDITQLVETAEKWQEHVKSDHGLITTNNKGE